MELVLNRYKDDGIPTLGILNVITDNGDIHQFYTMELPWKDNQHNISCIQAGVYTVVPRYSTKFKHHLHIIDVKNRKYILIHPANFVSDLRGCIGVGLNTGDINGDGELDITNSKKALKKILELLGDFESIQLTINYI